MPRIARKISITGRYHVVLRGNNGHQIFYDPEDYKKFYSLLVRYKSECGYKCHAWCMMPNHIHLLVEIKEYSLSMAIQRLTTAFVIWYNKKYKRVGHVFEGRFFSEPIDTDEYFFKAFRYINMNPVNGGICVKPEDFQYSSYNTYFNSARFPKEYLYFGLYTKDEFIKFHLEKNDDQFLDIDYYIFHRVEKK